MELLHVTNQPAPALDGAARTEADLIQDAMQGDQWAFATITSAYEKRVRWQCMRRGLSADEAADVSQDVFIKLFRNLHLYEPSNPFGTWLYRVTENACIDYCRSRQRRWAIMQAMPTDESGSQIEAIGTTLDPEQQLQANMLGERIADALAGLSPLLRAPFELKELEGLRYDQIAERLGVTVSTVKSRIFRARRALTQELADLV